VVTFETSLVIARPLAATFAFVTDFRNAARWDPRTYDARKVSDGDIGLHTRFVLRGGPITKATLDRFHVPEALRDARELPYEVVTFVPGAEMVARGETATMRYEDHLTFTAEGDATRLRYVATMELKGVLEIGEPILGPLFHAIGDDATRGIPGAVEAAVPASGPPNPALPGQPIVSPDDIARVVALDGQPVLRNLLITQGYHDLSKAIAAVTGGADMNWCTLGAWASRTAGTFIRDEEIPAIFRKLLDGPHRMTSTINDLEHRIAHDLEAGPLRLLDLVREIVRDCATYIMVGNRVVFAELAGCCAEFVHAFGNDRSYDAAKLAAFQARYRDGDPAPDQVHWGANRALVVEAQGGQAMLRGMVGHLYQAMFATDPKQRAEHILFANAQGGLHEQTRLQPYIAGGIDAPLTDALLGWAHGHVDRGAPGVSRGVLHAMIDAVVPAIGHWIERAWEDFSTDALMTLTLPDVVLHLGRPIPQVAGTSYWPASLTTIADPALAAMLAKYHALDVTLEETWFERFKDRARRLFHLAPEHEPDDAEVGALDWTSLDQRMRYILTLFRARQQDAHLFAGPFTDAQRAAIACGTVPPGPL
jgi:Polyketide cyclase / dehydrase and lipid transport